MPTVLAPLTYLPPPTPDLSHASQTGDPASLTQSFGAILTATLLGGGQSSPGGSGDSAAMMLPLMLGLLEQLLQQQLQEQSGTAKTGTASASSGAAQAVSASAEAQGVSLAGHAAAAVGEPPSGRPLGGVLTNSFHPGHNGLDFGVPVGTDVQATMGGKVIYAGWNNQGYGNLVIVENGPYRTYFAHLSQIPVKMGETVSAGSVVGISGNTGNSTGPHLHYEVRRDQAVIDPTSFTL